MFPVIEKLSKLIGGDIVQNLIASAFTSNNTDDSERPSLVESPGCSLMRLAQLFASDSLASCGSRVLVDYWTDRLFMLVDSERRSPRLVLSSI